MVRGGVEQNYAWPELIARAMETAGRRMQAAVDEKAGVAERDTARAEMRQDVALAAAQPHVPVPTAYADVRMMRARELRHVFPELDQRISRAGGPRDWGPRWDAAVRSDADAGQLKRRRRRSPSPPSAYVLTGALLEWAACRQLDVFGPASDGGGGAAGADSDDGGGDGAVPALAATPGVAEGDVLASMQGELPRVHRRALRALHDAFHGGGGGEEHEQALRARCNAIEVLQRGLTLVRRAARDQDGEADDGNVSRGEEEEVDGDGEEGATEEEEEDQEEEEDGDEEEGSESAPCRQPATAAVVPFDPPPPPPPSTCGEYGAADLTTAEPVRAQASARRSQPERRLRDGAANPCAGLRTEAQQQPAQQGPTFC